MEGFFLLKGREATVMKIQLYFTFNWLNIDEVKIV